MSIRNWYDSQNQQYDTGGDNPFVPVAQHAQANLWGGIGQASQFANGLEGQRENNITSQLDYLSPGGIQSQLQATRNGIFQNATQAGDQAAMSMRGMGYGDGASGGMLGAMLGQGQNQANQVTQQMSDPRYISSVLQQAYGTINQGMQNPLAQQAMAYEPYITSQNQTNYNERGQGLLGQIAPIVGAGMGSGGWLSSLFGGGSSGAGSASPFIGNEEDWNKSQAAQNYWNAMYPPY